MRRLRVLSAVAFAIALLGIYGSCLLRKAWCNWHALDLLAGTTSGARPLEGCNASLLSGAALSAARDGETNLAHEYLSLAEARDPEHPLVRFTSGYLALLGGEYEEAVCEWQSAGAHGYLLKLGDTYMSQREWERAVVVFTAALELAPSSEEISLKLARALQRSDSDRAYVIGFLMEIIAAKPETCEAYLILGGIYYDDGDLAQARQWYTRAVRVCPAVAGTWLSLGRFELLWATNADAALPALQMALMLDPTSGEAHVLLGRYLYQQGSLVEALAEVQRGIDLRPDGGWFYIVLGDVYRDLGQRAAACTAYERAISLGAEVEYARTQLQALGHNP